MGCDFARNHPRAYKPTVVASTAASFHGSLANQPPCSNFLRSAANFKSAPPPGVEGFSSNVCGAVFGECAFPSPLNSNVEPSSKFSKSSSGPPHFGNIASLRAAVSSPFGPYECRA